MSETEIELMRRQFVAFSEGDFDAATVELDPEVEWADPPEIPGASVHRTPVEVKRWFETFTEAWDEWEMEPRAITETDPGTYLATMRFSGRGRESGIEGEVEFWSLWRFRGGRPFKVENYMDRADADRAASITSDPDGG